MNGPKRGRGEERARDCAENVSSVRRILVPAVLGWTSDRLQLAVADSHLVVVASFGVAGGEQCVAYTVHRMADNLSLLADNPNRCAAGVNRVLVGGHPRAGSAPTSGRGACWISVCPSRTTAVKHSPALGLMLGAAGWKSVAVRVIRCPGGWVGSVARWMGGALVLNRLAAAVYRDPAARHRIAAS
jgi:hypothetical protein